MDRLGSRGSFRFLTRVWRLVTRIAPGLADASAGGVEGRGLDPAHRALRRKTHDTIRRVSADLDSRAHLNTAVSALMELVNELYAFCEGHDVKAGQAPEAGARAAARPAATAAVLREAIEALVLMLSPFTPHLCEELWERLGRSGGLRAAAWPGFDPAVARADEIVVPVQVNGKLRARLTVPAGVVEEDLREAALAESAVRAHTAGREIVRVVVVRGKLVNVVVR